MLRINCIHLLWTTDPTALVKIVRTYLTSTTTATKSRVRTLINLAKQIRVIKKTVPWVREMMETRTSTNKVLLDRASTTALTRVATTPPKWISPEWSPDIWILWHQGVAWPQNQPPCRKIACRSHLQWLTSLKSPQSSRMRRTKMIENHRIPSQR